MDEGKYIVFQCMSRINDALLVWYSVQWRASTYVNVSPSASDNKDDMKEIMYILAKIILQYVYTDIQIWCDMMMMMIIMMKNVLYQLIIIEVSMKWLTCLF